MILPVELIERRIAARCPEHLAAVCSVRPYVVATAALFATDWPMWQVAAGAYARHLQRRAGLSYVEAQRVSTEVKLCCPY